MQKKIKKIRKLDIVIKRLISEGYDTFGRGNEPEF